MDSLLLDFLGPDATQELRRRGRRRQFRRREVLFRQGDLGDAVYFIEQGHVAVRGEGALDTGLTLAVLGPGDYFGDIAVLSPDSRRSAGVVALEQCVTFEIGAAEFLELRDRHPAVRRAMAESLARTCRRLVGRILDARHADARGRMMTQLVRLDDLFDGPIPFTQEDLAEYVGVTRVTVNQILGRLADEQLIAVRRGAVELLDRAALERELAA